jgi:hypothetical protein
VGQNITQYKRWNVYLRSVIMIIKRAQSNIFNTQSKQEGSAVVKWTWNIHITNAATRTGCNTTLCWPIIIQTCKCFDHCSIFSVQQTVLTHSATVNSSCLFCSHCRCSYLRDIRFLHVPSNTLESKTRQTVLGLKKIARKKNQTWGACYQQNPGCWHQLGIGWWG